MSENYEEGFVEYTVTYELPSGFSFSGWDDGYIVFSKGEKLLKDILCDIKDKNPAEIFEDKVKGINGVQGYLMEVDLWRHKDGVYEEISVEREDRGFLVQQWKLDTGMKNNAAKEVINNAPSSLSSPAGGVDSNVSPPLTGGDKGEGVLCYLCYWRFAVTQHRGNSIFESEPLKSIEVIVPEHRLHFFITCGQGS